MAWWKNLKGKVTRNQLLKPYSTWRIGGPAEFFIEPLDLEDLRLVLREAGKNKLDVSVIGAGSNLLIDDKGKKGVVLKLNSPFFARIEEKGRVLEVGAGAALNKLLKFCTDNSLAGLEFLAGIPGTLGGALVMNAGITDKDSSGEKHNISLGDFVESVQVIDYNGKIKNILRKELKFSYRKSNLCKYIILNAKLKLVKSNVLKIKNKVVEYLKRRKNTQDLAWPSCGCVFKNPKNDSAGRLIDACNFKGIKVKDACVSKKHANFIVNLGNAKARDVRLLMGIITKEVKRRFGVDLKPEIKIW